MGNETRPQRRDVEYGYPTIERGTQFDHASKCDSLEILHYGSDDIRISSGRLDTISLREWLGKEFVTTEANDCDLSTKAGIRLLLGVCRLDPPSSNRSLPFTKDDFELISERYQLPERFLRSMQARISCTYKQSSRRSSAKDGASPITCYVFKFGIHQPSYYQLAISHCPSKNLTHALLLSKTNDHIFPHLIQRLNLFQQHSTHPLLLAALLSETCLSSSEARIQLSDNRLNGLEELMGQHEWINRPIGDPLKLDFVTTTRALNFTSRILGVEKMRVQSQLLSLSNILEEVELLHISHPGSEDTYIWMKESIANHKNTAQHLLLRCEYEEKRVQTHLAVVYQFMAQKDSKVNIQLAETSATIAREGKRDSSAMKAIAVLTMCFLPGTFLATIFAMPLFNWDFENGPRTKTGFKLYWAIAIPLTIFVLGIWILSMALPWTDWTSVVLKRKGPKQGSSEAGQLQVSKDE